MQSIDDARKVFVSNVADEITDDILKQFLACLGKITSFQRLTGPLRTYLVVFSTNEETKAALEANGTILIGRPIQIVTSRMYSRNHHGVFTHRHVAAKSGSPPLSSNTPPPQLSGSIIVPGSVGQIPATENAVYNENPYIKPVPNVPFTPVLSTGDDDKDREIARTIYIGNVNSRVSAAELVDFFSVCGPLAYIRMAGDDSQPTRFAFIEFLEVESAQRAMEMTGKVLLDRAIKVNRSNNTCVKPAIQLTRSEENRFQDAIYKLSKKLRKYDKRQRRKGEEEEEEGAPPHSGTLPDEERQRRKRKHRRSRTPDSPRSSRSSYSSYRGSSYR
jgi:arginine/serine-rich splicing factor 12